MTIATTPSWPTYVGHDPADGPGCGTAAHGDFCLCDVKLPETPTRTYVGRLAFSELAEDALASRGIDEPTTLQLCQQMLALKDSIAEAGRMLGPALALVVDASLIPSEEEIIELREELTGDAKLDGGIKSRARMTAVRNKRRLLQEALHLAPAAIVASAMGVTTAQAVGTAYGHTAANIERVVARALKGDNRRQIAGDAHMDDGTLRSILSAYRIPAVPSARTKLIADIIRLAGEGMSMAKIALKLDAPVDTVRKIAYGQRGPLHSLKVRIDELVSMGWSRDEIHAEMKSDPNLVDRLHGASIRSKGAQNNGGSRTNAIMAKLAS